MGTARMTHLAEPCVFGHPPIHSCKKTKVLKWLSKIFKGVSRKVRDRHSSSGFEDDNIICMPPSPSPGDEESHRADEELDHAIALSLAEEFTRNNAPREDNDEELARAIEASLSLDSNKDPPRQNHQQAQSIRSRICAGCSSQIGYGRFLSCMGALWHPDCFRCYACHEPIREPEFSMSENRAYHKQCYKELHHPRCDICYQFIPTNRNGLIEYRAHPYWGQRYCPSHEQDDTPRCCSCERMEAVQYVSLGDGRKLCLECLDSAVMDSGESQLLYHAIRDYYEGMNMRIDQQIPMLLVERQALNEAMEGEKDGRHHMPETRGLCLSEEQTVSSIVRRPRIGAGNRITDVKTGSQTLKRRCEVTAILVLYGLPRLLTGSILAHELMHGWLRLNGFRNLRPEVEEGICQVVSHMWLESEVMAGSSNNEASTSVASSSSSSKKSHTVVPNYEKKLGEFYKHQIETDSSPAYGDGFRAGSEAVNKYGLRSTLDHIRLTGNFPV